MTKMTVDHTATVSAFVRRLRRIAAHPLISTDAGESIQNLYETKFKTTVLPETGEVIMKWSVPDEVQFESLAARLRPMTLATDKLGYATVMNSLEALTDPTDLAIKLSNQALRQEWVDATQRDRNNPGSLMRAYWVVVDDVQASDLDLAYAWLYQDSMHGDLPTFDAFGPRERYKAATNVFAHVAVIALESLEYIRHLTKNGHLTLPEEAFAAEVVVTQTEWEERGKGMVGEPADSPREWTGPDAFDGMRPIHEVYPPQQ